MRRCVPSGQLQMVLQYCHEGGLKTAHHGQDSMWRRCVAEFDGVSRELVRMYVKKCAVCQQKQPRTHKAALVPILAKALYERVVIDLIDYSRKPSRGFHYILHATDHFSKCHWAWPLKDKTAEGVAQCLEQLFQETGPIKFLQCDNSKEFMAEVLHRLEDWGMNPPTNSSAYHPQTNGLVERYNGVLKVALNKWMIQERSEDWSTPLSRIVYQLNCTAPRTTRIAPIRAQEWRQATRVGRHAVVRAYPAARYVRGVAGGAGISVKLPF